MSFCLHPFFCCQPSFATSLFPAKQLCQAVVVLVQSHGSGDNATPVISDLGGLVYSKPTKKLHWHRLWLNWMIREMFRLSKGSCMQQNLDHNLNYSGAISFLGKWRTKHKAMLPFPQLLCQESADYNESPFCQVLLPGCGNWNLRDSLSPD